MVWVFLLLGAAVVAVLRKESFPAERLLQKPSPLPPPGKPAPPANAKLAGKVPPTISGLDFTDPKGLMSAATAAQEAGYVETAKALASRAQDLGDVVSAVEKGSTTPLRSPIKGVPDARWSAFVNLFKGRNPAEVSAMNQLGLFNISFLRLRDLKLATSVFQRDKGSSGKVWDGEFIAPMTLERFLSSPTVQYAVFVRDMQDRAAFIRSEYPHAIGGMIEGVPATLSGLMGAIKLAGTKGFAGWIASPAERRKFANTTAAYRTANGIF